MAFLKQLPKKPMSEGERVGGGSSDQDYLWSTPYVKNKPRQAINLDPFNITLSKLTTKAKLLFSPIYFQKQFLQYNFYRGKPISNEAPAMVVIIVATALPI
jgi:hypothetical protein